MDFGIVPQPAITEVRDAQNQITALLIAMIRNLEAEMNEEAPQESEVTPAT